MSNTSLILLFGSLPVFVLVGCTVVANPMLAEGGDEDSTEAGDGDATTGDGDPTTGDGDDNGNNWSCHSGTVDFENCGGTGDGDGHGGESLIVRPVEEGTSQQSELMIDIAS